MKPFGEIDPFVVHTSRDAETEMHGRAEQRRAEATTSALFKPTDLLGSLFSLLFYLVLLNITYFYCTAAAVPKVQLNCLHGELSPTGIPA